MKHNKTTRRSSEKGFTLVELAIVMIIIGLLIGGVLKGQELIANAQVTSTVAQLKGIDAAVSTFRDQYSSLPGDMPTASGANGRLPNCNAAPCINGNGNSRLGSTPNAAAQGGEALAFWAHMNAADLISGVNGTATVEWGEALPAADIGGGFVAGFLRNGSIADQTAGAAQNPRSGHYLVLRAIPDSAATAVDALLRSSLAFRLDQKMDDGGPNSGSVRAIGGVGNTGAACANTGAVGGVYTEALDGVACSLAIRIQG